MTRAHFEFMRHNVTFPLYVEIDKIYNLVLLTRRNSSGLSAANGKGKPLGSFIGNRYQPEHGRNFDQNTNHG